MHYDKVPVIKAFETMYFNQQEPKREFELFGKKKNYDVCGTGTLYEERQGYKPYLFEYIGSSRTYYINGTKNVADKLHHFFAYTEPYRHISAHSL